MFRNLTFISLGIGLAILESVLDHVIPFESLAPDLILPLVIYLGLLGFNAARGSMIVFVIGYVVGTLQPGVPVYMNPFLMVCLFLVTRLVATRLLLAGTVFHVALTAVSSIVASLIMVSLRAIFERQVGGLQPLLLIVATRAASTALAAPFVFALVRRVDSRRSLRREERLLR